MKKNYLIFDIILAVAIVVLYIIHFSTRPSKQVSTAHVISADSSAVMPMAYINVDSVLANYYFSKDLSEQLVRETESAHATMNQKAKSFQSEAAEFQRKAQNNAFLSQQSAEQQRDRLVKRQQELEELQQKLSMELQEKQIKTNSILRDTIMSQLALFNQEYHYQIIFSNTMNDNILVADKTYDITDAFIEFLNKKYVPKNTAEKTDK